MSCTKEVIEPKSIEGEFVTSRKLTSLDSAKIPKSFAPWVECNIMPTFPNFNGTFAGMPMEDYGWYMIIENNGLMSDFTYLINRCSNISGVFLHSNHTGRGLFNYMDDGCVASKDVGHVAIPHESNPYYNSGQLEILVNRQKVLTTVPGYTKTRIEGWIANGTSKKAIKIKINFYKNGVYAQRSLDVSRVLSDGGVESETFKPFALEYAHSATFNEVRWIATY